MKTPFLKNLRARINAETYKNAMAMAESGTIIFCFNSGGKDQTIVVIRQNKELAYLRLSEIYAKFRKNNSVPIKVEEAAALIFTEIFNSPDQLKTLPRTQFIASDSKKKRGSSISRNDHLDTINLPKYSNRLILNSEGGMPNTTSVWEHLKISIKIISGKKELIGNINKLNQIRDEKYSIHDGINTFPPQARQIIRFFTHYAEPDGPNYSLKSELLADLFHCLRGYGDFYNGPNRITLHDEPAEIAAVFCDDEHKFLKPAIVIGNHVIILEKHQIVAGKAGLWIGINGEYWFTPATTDIIWLRNFILSDTPLAYSDSIPIKIRENKSHSPINQKCLPVYCIDYSPGKSLSLELYFEYNAERFSISDNFTESTGDVILLRNKKEEKRLENSLYKAGFRILTDSTSKIFCLKDSEAIALFIDKLLPEWMKDNSDRVYFTKDAATLAASEITALKLSCKIQQEVGDRFILNYKLSGRSNSSSSTITWKQLQSAVKEHRNYLIVENKIYSISEELAVFTEKMHGVAMQDKLSRHNIDLPRGAQLYWIDKATDIPTAIPQEWTNVKPRLAENLMPPDSLSVSLNTGFTGVLREYQKKAVVWMCKMMNDGFSIILADEMGLGKTVQALALLNHYFRTTQSPKTCLIVCPTSLVENWESETTRFVPNLTTQAIKGINRTMLIDNVPKFNLAITSYSLIKRDIKFYEKIEFGIVILDEAQHIKNPATANARVCKTLKCNHRIVLSGTPLENSPDDVWSIFDFLNPGMLGNHEIFKKLYLRIENDKEMQDELAARIAPFILRRHKKDVEDLPEKITQTLFCDMSDAQREIYNNILSEGKNQFQSFNNGKSTRFDILSSLLRLRQLCCHPALLPDNIRDNVEESAKTDLLKEVVFEAMDSGHRTLIFSQFTTLLAIIRKWCDKEKIVYEYLDGSIKNRLERVNNFNNNKNIPLFLLSLKAGGTGLNLTGADTVIIYDPWWNPSVESQAADRSHRIGQAKPVTTIKLVVKDSVEERILDLQAKKQGMFNRIIENNSTFSKLTTEDLAYLLNLSS